MSKTSVLVATNIDEDLIEKVHQGIPQARVTFLSAQQLNRWQENRPLPIGGGDSADSQGNAIVDALAETEVIFCGPQMPSNIVEASPKLQWVQLRSAGLDRLLNHPIVNRATITTGSGNQAGPIAEYVIGLMLMFSLGWPGLYRDQVARRYQPFRHGEIYGKTVGIVGLGHIGEEVARLATAFNMRVIGTRRSTTERVFDARGYQLLPPSDLHELLAASDFVVLAMPLTKESYHMIGEKELRAMGQHAYLINIARGAVVDEPVLIRALQEKWIAGAGLDVTEIEPLPPESPLWDLENVTISPHHIGMTKETGRRAVDLFIDNLQRYIAKQPLLNVVDMERGY